MKRVVVLSDLHSGHLLGLTPPGYQTGKNDDTDSLRHRCGKIQRDIWAFFDKEIQKLQPVDICLVNGDAIDGKGAKSGGTEQITTDRTEQVDMAANCIGHVKADRVVMTYGTGYHTGTDEDWETLVAQKFVGAKIDNYQNLDIEGTMLNVRHHVGRSQIPHGRHTAVAREHMWNVMLGERGDAPKADIIIRSHTHYYAYCGGPDWLGLTTPALCAAGTKFGARICSGIVDVGFVSFDIEDDGRFSWTPHIANFKSLTANVLKL